MVNDSTRLALFVPILSCLVQGEQKVKTNINCRSDESMSYEISTQISRCLNYIDVSTRL